MLYKLFDYPNYIVDIIFVVRVMNEGEYNMGED